MIFAIIWYAVGLGLSWVIWWGWVTMFPEDRPMKRVTLLKILFGGFLGSLLIGGAICVGVKALGHISRCRPSPVQKWFAQPLVSPKPRRTR